MSNVSIDSGFGEVNAWCTAVHALYPRATSPRRSPPRWARTGRIHDPDERPRLLVDQTLSPSDLDACRAEQRPLRLRRTRGEEDTVARVCSDVRGQAVALGVGEVLRDGPAQRAVLADEHVRQAFRAALLGPLLPRVELPARLARPTRHDDRTDVGRLEHPERCVGEELGALGDLEAEAQIGLVRAESAHRLGVGQLRDRGRDVVADELPQRDEDVLGQQDHVLLAHEAHLDVELGELGLAVGAEVLVAVAARDLEVPLDARDHQQLLEQLRALRQRVERAGLQPGGHQEVARALRCRPGQCRRLHLDEAVAGEHVARGGVHLRPQPDRVPRRLAAQVEVTVLEPGLLAGLVVELEWQRCALVEHLDSVTSTSIVPVGISRFSLPAGRSSTTPLTFTQNSARSRCAACAASPERNTTCTTPDASRRSTKMTPPWSRRRATHPARVTV